MVPLHVFDMVVSS